MKRLSSLVLCIACLAYAPDALARYGPKELVAPGGPAGLSLATRAQADGYAGFLGEAAPRFPSAVLLTRGPVRLTAGPSAEAAPPSRAELEAEYKRLEGSAPSLGAPIGLTVCGVVASVVGFYVLLFGVVLSSTPAIVIALVLFAGGVAMGVYGGILLGQRIYAKVQRTRRMNQLEDELRGPAQEDAPPLMIERLDPTARPRVVLARF